MIDVVGGREDFNPPAPNDIHITSVVSRRFLINSSRKDVGANFQSDKRAFNVTMVPPPSAGSPIDAASKFAANHLIDDLRSKPVIARPGWIPAPLSVTVTMSWSPLRCAWTWISPSLSRKTVLNRIRYKLVENSRHSLRLCCCKAAELTAGRHIDRMIG